MEQPKGDFEFCAVKEEPNDDFGFPGMKEEPDNDLLKAAEPEDYGLFTALGSKEELNIEEHQLQEREPDHDLDIPIPADITDTKSGSESPPPMITRTPLLRTYVRKKTHTRLNVSQTCSSDKDEKPETSDLNQGKHTTGVNSSEYSMVRTTPCIEAGSSHADSDMSVEKPGDFEFCPVKEEPHDDFEFPEMQEEPDHDLIKAGPDDYGLFTAFDPKEKMDIERHQLQKRMDVTEGGSYDNQGELMNVEYHQERSNTGASCSDRSHGPVVTSIKNLDSKQYKCRTCGKIFSKKSILARHLLTHLSTEPHKCDVCDMYITSGVDVEKHMLAHSGVKTHKCDVCDMYITCEVDLEKHIRGHFGVKTVKCEMCRKFFKSRSYLTKHMLIHSRVIPHKYVVCGKTFNNESALAEHVRTHSGITPHNCGQCGKTFTD